MPRLSNRCSRTMLRIGLAAASLAFGRAGLGDARADDAVLLASTVPGYVPGMVLSSADRLNVPDGATVTLLFQSGEMLRLRGPFEGTLGHPQSAAAAGSAAVFASMFRMQGADATVIGGTRSAGSAGSLPELDDVEVDPERSGTYCVGPDTSVWIRHPAAEGGAYALRRKDSLRDLAWPSGTERVEWPADLPIEDGNQVEITTGGTARAMVTFRGLPATAASLPAWIASGIVLGCHDQFDHQLRRFSQYVLTPDLWITTDRGRKPVYKPGEPISLTIVSNTDGFLYCVAAGDDGSVKPIFPAGAVDGAQLRGSVPLAIPGRRQPSGPIAAAGTTGQIRCWLADRDIAPELPHALLGVPSARLPDQLAGDLDGLFSHIGGTRIEANVLTVVLE